MSVIYVREIDHSVMIPGADTKFLTCSIGTISNIRITKGDARYKPKLRIKLVGRYYTSEQVDATCVPNSLLFKTRRGAKKFFSKPLYVSSEKQLTAIYGQPCFAKADLVVKSPEDFWTLEPGISDELRAKAKAIGLSDTFFDMP
jgi:hypothetical protein